MSAWELFVVAGMALVTFGVRYPALTLIGRMPLPPSLLAALKFVPPAVLTALIVPSLLAPVGGDLHLSLTNPYLVAGLIAALVAWRTGKLLLTIFMGMGTFWLWGWFVAIFSAG
jgi:branched-subunit amino acid transport protein